MASLKLSFASGESSLDVRRFMVTEAISTPFLAEVVARSPNPELNLGSLVGTPAALQIASEYRHALNGGKRLWSGVCAGATQVQAEPTGLSTYRLRIVPNVWLLTQRRGQRIFQHMSIPDIIDELLAQWKVDRRWVIDRQRYPKLEFKIQFGETDYAFMSRLLEEAGIAFVFDETGERSLLTLGDQLQAAAPRPSAALPYVDNPNQAAQREHVTRVRMGHEVRPGAHTIVDYDFRRPGLKLLAAGRKATNEEGGYEQFQYRPGSMLAETSGGGDTPVADDQAVARYLKERGDGEASKVLASHRTGRERVAFDTNVVDLRPGRIFSMDHPHPELEDTTTLLVTSFRVEGTSDGEWFMGGRAVLAAKPYRPRIRTPKPKLSSVQTAIVVGPRGQEIHTDEFGRVRIHFPWDRDGTVNERSSCWIRPNQGWAGQGFGLINLPRIGQEVLISFLDGDPDQPILVGRTFNAINPVPYKLPDNKTISTQKSNASLGSQGFNEWKYEDRKGEELLYQQAEKNHRKLVKNDQIMTIGHDRRKLVKHDESDTTGVDRFEVTKNDRTESTKRHRDIAIYSNRYQRVDEDENERTDGKLESYLVTDRHRVVKQNRKQRIERDHHQFVYQARNQSVTGKHSVIVKGSRHERIMGRQAVETGGALHIWAGNKLVAEGVEDVTFRAPGGFIRINDEGITIRGNVININSGGGAGEGAGAGPSTALAAGEVPFQISPERVAEILSVSKQHAVPVPSVLRDMDPSGVVQLALEGLDDVTIQLAAEEGSSAAHKKARVEVARAFYQQQGGMNGSEIRGHLRGIDVSKPVTFGPLPPCNTPQAQWQVPGGRGRYYADPGTAPEQLGISAVGTSRDAADAGAVVDKAVALHDVDPNVPYLQSTAAPLDDTWSVSRRVFGTEGGGVQRFLPKGHSLTGVGS